MPPSRGNITGNVINVDHVLKNILQNKLRNLELAQLFLIYFNSNLLVLGVILGNCCKNVAKLDIIISYMEVLGL